MKMNFRIIKLYFKEPLALMSEKKDEFKNEVSVLASDLVKAAILSSLAKIKPDKLSLLNDDLITSSAYLFYGNRYFFPKPAHKLPILSSKDVSAPKRIKNISWVEQTLFEKIIRWEAFALNPEHNLLQNGQLLVSDKLNFPPALFSSQTEERVSIGNTVYFEEAEKGSPYYISRTYFFQGDKNHPEKSGLYFIYQSNEEELLKQALNILKDEGLGADRRVGNGKFDYELTETSLEVPDKFNRQIILSKYVPEADTVKNGLLDNAAYGLTKRNGYVAGTTNENYAQWQKKTVFMLNEGSVFETGFTLKGKTVNLATETLEQVLGHKVYREGRPVSIPALLKE